MSERRQPDDLFEAALAKGLRREGQTIAGCPDADTLAAYWDKSLDTGERQRWDQHFAECGRCRAQLGALARTAATEGNLAPGLERSPRRLGWFLDVRWLAPAASLAAVLLAVWVIEPRLVREQQKVADAPDQAAQAPAPPVAPELQTEAFERTEPRQVAAEPEVAAAPPAAPIPLEAAAPTSLEEEVSAADEFEDTAAEAQPLQPRVGLSGTIADLESRADALRPRSAPAPPPTRRALEVDSLAAEAAREASAEADNRILREVSLGAGVAVSAPNSTRRWRATGGGDIERTDDGGVTWTVQRQASDDRRWLAGAAPSGSIVWFVGTGGAVIRTTDGETWRPVASPTGEDLVEIDAASDATATVTTATGRQFLTTDSGATWREP